MHALNVVLSILFIIVCIILTVIILMQDGRDSGLGAISGMADSYWGKIKSRSVEGTLEKLTRVCAVLFIVLAFILNIVK